MLMALVISMLAAAQAAHAKTAKVTTIQAAGITVLAGGTGPPNFVPVETLLAVNWDGTAGTFDCLALAPSHTASTSGSGDFDTNIMYVDGTITSVTISGDTAILNGTSDCTGLGAGLGVPFTATVQRGGPGARITLKVSGLSFTETMLNGQISF